VLENVKTIKFNSKYVSGPAKELITNFDRNTYIIKGSTGIGGTTSLLNYKDTNCLIISPNVGMIKGKEGGKYHSDKQVFIYGGSKDKWKDVSDYLDTELHTNLIINTTPDQICILRDNHKVLYNKIRTLNVFIDEFHVYTSESTYRKSVGQLMELVFNEWIAKYKLSTATPNFNFIDIPNNTEIDIYRIERGTPTKKQLKYSQKLTDVKPFVYDEVAQGRMVVVFTNNTRLHKQFTDLKVHNLTGETLRVKLAPFERGNKGIKIPTDTQLLIASSSYYAGFDIDTDCSMIFVSEDKYPAFKINLNNLIQAYGRCRGIIHNALYINYKSKINDSLVSLNDVNNAIIQSKQSITRACNELNKSVSYLSMPQYINKSEYIANALEKANDYIQYNNKILTDVLEYNNFVVVEYDNTYINNIVNQSTSITFAQRIKT
jgi:hypothetical protein